MPRVLNPLPDADFDTTERAVPWPGDAWLFARTLVAQLKAQRKRAAA